LDVLLAVANEGAVLYHRLTNVTPLKTRGVRVTTGSVDVDTVGLRP